MITITRTPEGYSCVATPLDVQPEWSTEAPTTLRRLIDELRSRGAHQTDIGDALYASNPNWLEELKKEE